MRQRWKAFFDGSTHRHHGQYKGQTDISHDGSAHQPRSLVITNEVRHDVHRRTGGPWNQTKLSPETTENNGHVESKYERQWNEVAEVETVYGHRLKRPVQRLFISPISR